MKDNLSNSSNEFDENLLYNIVNVLFEEKKEDKIKKIISTKKINKLKK